MRNMSVPVRLLGGVIAGFGLFTLYSGLQGMSVNPLAALGMSDLASLWTVTWTALLALSAAMSLLTGLGLLLLRSWGLTLGTLFSVNILVNLVWRAWFYGPQKYGIEFFVIWGVAAIALLAFLWQPSVWTLLKVHETRSPFIPRFLAVLFGLTIAGKLLLMPAVSAFVIMAREGSSDDDVKTVRYEAPARSRSTSERQLLGYTLRLPKDMALNSAFAAGEPPVWHVFLMRMRGDREADVLLKISSKSVLDEYGGTIASHFGFLSAFDMEQALYRRSWSPVLAVMRRIVLSDENEEVVEVNADGWHGFVRERRSADGTVSYICQAYDGENKRSADVVLMVRDEALTERQAKDILASFRFDEGSKPAERYFDEGRAAAKKGARQTALERYLNALYRDPDNAEYAYHVGDIALVLGYTRMAEEYFKRAEALDPGNEKVKQALQSLAAVTAG